MKSAETDVYKNRKCAPWLRMVLQFYNFLDWRVVEADDASGQRCRCLLLPMEKNHIWLGHSGPVTSLMFLRYLNTYPNSKSIAKAVLYASKADRKLMKDSGYGVDGRGGLLPDVGLIIPCLYNEFKFDGKTAEETLNE